MLEGRIRFAQTIITCGSRGLELWRPSYNMGRIFFAILATKVFCEMKVAALTATQWKEEVRAY